MTRRSVLARALEKVIIDRNGCWLWTACTDDRDYALLWVDGRSRRAHRVLYELLVGDPGPELDHLCRVHSCVRPSHMEPVTHQENVRRGDVPKINGGKTHCIRGHPFDEENTYITKAGKRSCRTCQRVRAREWFRTNKSKGRWTTA